eukprot:TRINITY_DN252_c0_g1_i1.p1 TRINITY_DN252_c0_g1~~TRINITY_DN252_c0_g1_i1.p1  ORF type:complete len:317 (-),score=52.67 TRINITY_DN252_c0_g1_i1:228-1178(-)
MNTSRAIAGLLRRSISPSAFRSFSISTTTRKTPPVTKYHFQTYQEPQPRCFLVSSLRFASFASPESSKPLNNAGEHPGSVADEESKSCTDEHTDTVSEEQEEQNEEERRRRKRRENAKPAERIIYESDLEDDGISREELIELVREREQLLKAKHKEIQEMQEKVLRSYAEAENVKQRTRRDAENSKKFAVQSFAKSLLDVADNLGRASSVVKESFSKIDSSEDVSGATSLLKTLLEGVEMTEKQLSEVLKKHGIEKFDPLHEIFDPNRHMAVFQVPDPERQPGTVAVVLKAGYTLHERVIRPAEVGVVVAKEAEST